MTIPEIIKVMQQRYKLPNPYTVYVTYPPRLLPDGVPDHHNAYCPKYPLRVDVPGVPSLSDVAVKLKQQLPAWRHNTCGTGCSDDPRHVATWGEWSLTAQVIDGQVHLALNDAEADGPDLASALSEMRDYMKERRAAYEHICELLRSP